MKQLCLLPSSLPGFILVVLSTFSFGGVGDEEAISECPTDRIALAKERIRERLIERQGLPSVDRSSGTATESEKQKGVVGYSYTEGANCLFIGHSFFVPVAKSFDQLASQSEFPAHQSKRVFSPGMSGSPGALWNNDNIRERVETELATGSVELFGMAVAGRADGSAEKDYRRWIDLALKHNPETRFFIGQYWIPGGPNAEEKQYEMLNREAGRRNFETVVKLREAYPNNPIHFVNYGPISSAMKTAFNAGALPDIDRLVGFGPTALYRDAKLGHGGALMHELCALIWLSVLYDADIDAVAHSDFSEEARQIVQDVIDQNTQFQ